MVKRAIEGMVDKRVGYLEEYPEKQEGMGASLYPPVLSQQEADKKQPSLNPACSESILRISQRLEE
jgi:hypothetical protein